ncbi:TdeIII family type II restriction endonuclease [Pedobacter sp. SG908]|uniref:TdeIII family type II restriction endonuclease n=1 Tax=Pedobacter sp. SG908 TaxID=2587135 RepID=UPI00141E71FA|nr:TdeIII family type II restriction endonuclease [Pedobacter sp. SG908]NII83163.1 hypothetical protein [Pedobacter sp. SG908]
MLEQRKLSDAELMVEIKTVVVSSIRTYIKNYDKKSKTFHPLDYLIPTERKIRSIVGGIETSIGSTLWEPLAKRLAELGGFEVLDQKLNQPEESTTFLSNVIANVKEERITRSVVRDINSVIRENCQHFAGKNIPLKVTTKGQGVDIWLRKKKTGIHYLFDTKTVRPNMEKFKDLFRQIVDWYSYFYTEFPLEKAECRIVFPYNPFGAKDFWEKSIKKGWPLAAHSEAWVGNEFWNFLSERENTLELIFEAFMEVKTDNTLELEFKALFN